MPSAYGMLLATRAAIRTAAGAGNPGLATQATLISQESALIALIMRDNTSAEAAA